MVCNFNILYCSLILIQFHKKPRFQFCQNRFTVRLGFGTRKTSAKFHTSPLALRHTRECLDDETTRTIVSSMVGASPDYGLSSTNTNKLQHVPDSLALVVTGSR